MSNLSGEYKILPPGADIKKEGILGQFWIQTGRIEWINKSLNQFLELKIKFWGQSESEAVHLRTLESNLNQLPKEILYVIVTSQQKFKKYLNDMEKLKIILQDQRNQKPIGLINIDFHKMQIEQLKDKQLQLPIKNINAQAKEQILGQINLFININFDIKQPPSPQTTFHISESMSESKYNPEKYEDEIKQNQNNNNQNKNNQNNNNNNNNQNNQIQNINQNINQNNQSQNQPQQNVMTQSEIDYDDKIQKLLNRGQNLQNKLKQDDLEQTQKIDSFAGNYLNPKSNDLDLQTIAINVDQAKIIKQDVKLDQQEVYQEQEENEDLVRLQVQEFTCKNQQVFDYLKGKNIYLECVFPDQNLIQVKKKKEQDIKFQFQYELPFQIDLCDEILNQQQIEFKMNCKQDKFVQEIGKCTWELKVFDETKVRQNYLLTMETKIPLEKLDNQQEQVQQESKLQKIDQNQIIGTLRISTKMDVAEIQIPQKEVEKKDTYLQALLNITRIVFFEQEKVEVYLRYRTLSSETIQTECYWVDDQQILDHKVNFFVFEDKLDRPLLIEVWAKQPKEKLMGLVRLQLPEFDEDHPINNPYNLNSCTLFEGDYNIQELRSNQPIGQLQLLLSIGTTPQIARLERQLKQNKNIQMNQTEEQENKNPPQQLKQSFLQMDSQQIQQIQQQQQEQIQQQIKNFNFEEYKNLSQNETQSILLTTLILFEDIRRNQSTYQNQLKNLITNKEIPVEQFVDFVKNFQNQQSKIAQILKVFNFNDQKQIESSEFTQSYQAYCQQEEVIRKSSQELMRQIKEKINVDQIEKALIRESEFGFIQKPKLAEILRRWKIDQTDIQKIIMLLSQFDSDQYIFIQNLIDYLKQDELISLQPNELLFLTQFAFQIKATTLRNYSPQTKDLDIINLNYSLDQIGLKSNLWYSLLFIFNLNDPKSQISLIIPSDQFKQFLDKIKTQIEIHSNMESSHVVDFDQELEHLANLLNEKNVDSNISQINIDDNKIQDIDSNIENDKQQNQQIKLNESDINSDISQSQVINKTQVDDKINEKENNNQIENQIENQIIENNLEQARYIKHLFKVKVNKVSDLKMEDSLVNIRYKFPGNEKEIESIEFKWRNDVVLKSEHEITLPKNEQLNFKEKGIRFQLLQRNQFQQKVLGEAILPLISMLELQQDQTHKLVLYDENRQYMGLLQLQITYEQQAGFESVLLQKQFTVDRLLPKNGNIYIQISNIYYIKTRPNFNFHSFIRINLFSQDSNLNPLIFTTQKVYNDLQYNINYQNNIPITLSQSILDYFNHNSATIQLVIENNQQQEYILGSANIPMVDLVTSNQGIFGEIPLFSNDNIFIGSSKLQIQYLEKSQNQQQSQKTTMIVSLKEIINIINEEMKFLKELKENKTIYFQISILNQTFASQTYTIQNNQKIFENCNFIIQINDLYQLNDDFEIKIFDNQQNTLISFAKIKVKDLIQQNKKRIQLYFNLVNQSQLLKQRMMVIINFIYDDVDNEEFFNQILEKEHLSQKDINKLKSLKFDRNMIDYVEDEDQFIIQDKKVIQEILKEFQFYDYENQGHIDFDDAKRILILFENYIKDIDSNRMKQFESFNQIDSNCQIFKLQYQFDYIKFLRLIQEEKQEVEQIQIQNLDKQFVITIVAGQNIHQLNKGIPPNSYIQCNTLNIQTQSVSRQTNPQFNEKFQITTKEKELHFYVCSKKYCSSLDQNITNNEIIGEALINISNIKTDSENTFEIPIFQNGTQTNSLLKLKIDCRSDIAQFQSEEFKESCINNDIYNNIKKTLQELSQNDLMYKSQKIQSVQFKSQNINQLPLKISKQQNYTQQSNQNKFATTLEQLSQLNIDLDGNLKSLGSFGQKTQVEQENNPFQNNHNYKSNYQQNYQDTYNFGNTIKFLQDDQIKINEEDICERSSVIKSDSQNSKPQFPILQKSMSFKKLEEKLKQSDVQELNRIASIMKQNFSKSFKIYDLSSDSD